MGSPIGHFEILGTDAGRLRDFYTDIFGWAAKHPPEEGDPLDYTMISTGSGDGTLEGGIGRNPEGRGALTFYVHVQNLEATLARSRAPEARPSGSACGWGRTCPSPCSETRTATWWA